MKGGYAPIGVHVVLSVASDGGLHAADRRGREAGVGAGVLMNKVLCTRARGAGAYMLMGFSQSSIYARGVMGRLGLSSSRFLSLQGAGQLGVSTDGAITAPRGVMMASSADTGTCPGSQWWQLSCWASQGSPCHP
jgi:hypothetical protein